MSNTPAQSFPLNVLLENAAWTRRLAVRLVGDADDAEDVVQETWISAFRSPPDGSRPARPWLRTVVRNSWSKHLRSLARRRAREEAAAVVDEPSASQEDLLARLELQRLVVNAVSALDEPFRGTILLRYFEGKSSADIAAALGVPAGTVRWRLKEGVDRLRHSLNLRNEGDRDVWKRLVAPWIPRSKTAAPFPAAGHSALKATVGFTLAVAVFAGFCMAWPRDPAGRRSESGGGAGGPPRSSSAVVTAAANPPIAKLVADSRGGRGSRPSRGLVPSLDDCRTEVARLRPEVASIAAVVHQIEPRPLFARGQPNPAAEAAFAPIIAAAVKGGLETSPPHRFECRTWVCRLTVVLSVKDTAWVKAWAAAEHAELAARSARRTGGDGSGPPVKDALTGELMYEWVSHMTLADPHARPVLAGQRAGRPPQFRTLPQPLPATVEACQAELRLLHQSLVEKGQPEELEALSWLGLLAADFEKSTAPDGCQAKFPETGFVVVRFDLPSAERASQEGTPRRINTRYAGPLARTPLGRCIADEIARYLLKTSLPDLPSNASVATRFDFPRR